MRGARDAQELRCPARGRYWLKTNQKMTAFRNGGSLGFPHCAAREKNAPPTNTKRPNTWKKTLQQ